MIKKINIDGADMEFNIVKSGVQLCFAPNEFHKARWGVILVEKDDEGVCHITKLDECNDLAGANKSFELFRARYESEAATSGAEAPSTGCPPEAAPPMKDITRSPGKN